METLLDDLRFSFRSLIRKPLFTSVAMITLALGIGTNAAMYSVIHAAVLSDLPYPEPEALLRIYSTFEGEICCTVSAPSFVDLRNAAPRGFEDLAAFGGATVTITGGDEPLRVSGNRVSAGFFELLGAQARVGRLIGVEDDRHGAEPVVVLADSLWRDRFGGDTGVIGESLVIDSVPHTIIGVAPPGFRVTGTPQLFLPFGWDPGNMPARGSNFLFVIGRLAEGATQTSAMAELATAYAALVDQYPDQIVNDGIAARTLDEWLIGDNRRRPLLVLWGAVGMVLLVASVNVVNLMLARAEARHRELAVRAALGAARGRLIRHFLSESLLVSTAGAALGVAGAWVSLRVLVGSYGNAIPRGQDVGINGGVLLFVVTVTLATGLLVGLVPALQTGSKEFDATLRAGGRGATGGRTRLRGALVVAEVAASLVLVVGAGLMLKSFWRLSQVDVGVEAESILTLRLSLPASRYPDQADRIGFFEEVRDEIARLPAVAAAGFVSDVPFSEAYNNYSQVMPVGMPERFATFVEARWTGPQFFSTLGLSLLQGRNFDRRDNAEVEPTVIINRALAEQLFADGDPIGAMITSGPGGTPWQVIGVVADVREHGPERPAPPTVYFSHLRGIGTGMALAVRAAGGREPLDLVPDVRRIVAQRDSELPVFSVNRFDQLIYDGLGSRRFNMSLLSVFAGLALALGAVGIYGVMAYNVEQRRREMGLRLALGASPAAVLGLVIRQGTGLTLAGIAIGALGAYLLRQTLAGMLYEVSSLDPVVFALVAAILALVAAVACWVPARRAAAVDPMVALRD